MTGSAPPVASWPSRTRSGLRRLFAGVDPTSATAVRVLILGLGAGLVLDTAWTLSNPMGVPRVVFSVVVATCLAVLVAYFTVAAQAYSGVAGIAPPVALVVGFMVAGACGTSCLWYAAVAPAAWLGLHFGYRGMAFVWAVNAPAVVVALILGTGDKSAQEAIAAFLMINLSSLPMAIVQTSFAQTARGLMKAGRSLETLTNAVDVGLLSVDSTGEPISQNPQMADYLRLMTPPDRPGEELVYDAEGAVLLPADMRPIRRALDHGDFERNRIWVGEDPKTRRALVVTGRRTVDDAGRVEGATFAFHDVTALVRALKVREHLVSSVSHELRTPLTSIIGFCELASSEEVSEDVRGYLDRVHHNAWRLHQLVEDLLAAADAESQVRTTRLVDLADLLEPAREAMAMLSRSTGVEIQTSAVSAPVLGDMRRLEQVLVNLISNAVKYSRPGGRVSVEVSRAQGWAHLSVRDDGIGISADEVERLFERFYRAETARQAGIPGIGLGLAICRDIVREHGGTISVTSTLGEGSWFEVALPLATSGT